MPQCSAEWPLVDAQDRAVSWWPCDRKDKHTVHHSEGKVYVDRASFNATIELRWKDAPISPRMVKRAYGRPA